MAAAEALTGVDIRQVPQTWSASERLVRTVVEHVYAANTVLLGVCTPQQLSDWPHGDWLLLDCADKRRIRLAPRGNPAETEQAIADAALYRTLGLPVLDTTDLEPREVAEAIAKVVHDTGRQRSARFDVDGGARSGFAAVNACCRSLQSQRARPS